jgi:diadenosine tetraphosphatase ApaH/serine/threonine PP2A family protein phosphatase
VLGAGGANPDAPEREFFTYLELEHTLEPTPSHEAGDPTWHDDSEVAVQPIERSEVEMVVVRVGNEDRVEISQRLCGDDPLPPEMPDARSQNRVGDDPRALEVDHDGAVPEPGQPAQRSSA